MPRGSDILQHSYHLISVQNMETGTFYLLFINQVRWIVLNLSCWLFLANSSIITSHTKLPRIYFHLFTDFICTRISYFDHLYKLKESELEQIIGKVTQRHCHSAFRKGVLEEILLHWYKKKMHLYISILMPSRCLTPLKVTSSQIAEVCLGKKKKRGGGGLKGN